jgi:tetrahydromethanopterin S-methyltransferase subunit E
MRTRYFTLFWGATFGAVLFLGAAWTTFSRTFSPRGSILDGVVLAVAGLGILFCAFIAGRIVLVTARAQRKHRGR